MRRLFSIHIILLLLVLGASDTFAIEDRKGIFAEIQTHKGNILLRLFYEKVPMTVSNFIGLSEGIIEWKDPETGEPRTFPFYNGLTFHRVIPGLMVQGGDPKGNGYGGPGYNLKQEFHDSLRHNRPGILSMLNKGPFVHGSQFLITLKATPFLDDKHTIFGEVVDGQEVIDKIQKGDRIINVLILRRGARAEAFDLAKHVEKLRLSAENIKVLVNEMARKQAQTSPGIDNKKELPNRKGKIDPARVPQKNQPENQKIALEYILITYKGARSPIDFPFYDREGAKKVAQQLADLARVEGSDFIKLAIQFSDSSKYRIPVLTKNQKMAPSFESVFRLREGQISDPIEAPEGFYLFHRVKLETISVRHILISYQGARNSHQNRSKEDARNLANNILNKVRSGEDFVELVQIYSDSDSAQNDGLIGELVRGKTMPAFEHAAFSLNINEISDVTITPAGFQIIKRVE